MVSNFMAGEIVDTTIEGNHRLHAISTSHIMLESAKQSTTRMAQGHTSVFVLVGGR